MTPKMKLRTLAFVAVAAVAATACAQGVSAEEMWARPTAPGATNAAFYGAISNDSGEDSEIGHFYSPVCGRIELHNTEMTDGVMEMRPADPSISQLSDGDSITLEPQALHFMCLDLQEPLVEGEKTTLEITFEGVEVIVVDVAIEDR